MAKFIFDLDEAEFESHLRYEADLPRDWLHWVLDRDGFCCKRCNAEDNLHPHHVIFRSAGRDHNPKNLVTLCARCHRRVHDGLVWIYTDPEGNSFFGGSRADLIGGRKWQ